ncbi:FMN-dependent NADH-azoreductase [Thioclava sp. SK-1]|uniref:FMN-dependent NADH-azoreductase n=1 Tax=Thioclava sp. SK-1 TaxID=1889770 RepID=UPI000826274E|nr:NAD(P)H-dependent oxidoreductase [Thioclava sp. SK-1]OCX66965.1 FMN-dependent NADH-azoreductase [Thioclava sp. SK-1]
MKILRIDSSIKGDASVTRQLTAKITEQLGGDVVVRDTTTIPLIDGTWIGAAYTPADKRTDEQKELLALSEELIAEIKDADAIVVGMPLYNFGVTGPLKAWIDMICRVGETFQYTEEGPRGLVSPKRVYVAYASGGVPQGSGYDLATAYVTQVFGFIGLTDLTFISAEGVAMGEAEAIAKAEEQIKGLAA